MTARDLTWADAEAAIFRARLGLAGLNHLAIAGLLHIEADPANLAEAMRILGDTYGAALDALAVLSESARQLPEEAP